MNPLNQFAVLAGAAVIAVTTPAFAEKADRDKPVNLEADHVSVDDVKKVQIFEGNVQLAKGSLVIRAERIVVMQDDGGYQRGIASGSAAGPATFRQKREGLNEFIEGEAERIEHDAASERTEFFGRARVKSGLDEVRGQFIAYDARTEQYVVTSGPNGTRAPSGSRERVRAVIQPKSKDASEAPVSASASTAGTLRGASGIASPSQEKTQ